MSMETPSKRQHRHTRSAATPSLVASTSPYPQRQLPISQTAIEASGPNSTIQPSTPPRTPRKRSPSAAQPKPISNGTDVGAKQKNRNKNRSKNMNVSPTGVQLDRNTPPLKSGGLPQPTASRAVTTPSSAAYAGPTFHASPAPSALPIPSYYSKSVPESPAGRLILQKKDPSQSNGLSPSNDRLILSRGDVEREESPLDFFFKLDREEKARARSASSTQQSANSSGPFQIPVLPQGSQTPPATSAQSRQSSNTSNRNSSGGIFPFEMESPGSQRTPYGPAFSTPYNERINAARSSTHRSNVSERLTPTNPHVSDRSALLKDYLFNGHPPPPPHTAPSHSAQVASWDAAKWASGSSIHTPLGRSSGLRQEVTPTKTPTQLVDTNPSSGGSPTPIRQYRNANQASSQGALFRSQYDQASAGMSNTAGEDKKKPDLNGLENHLRQILNLKTRPGSSSD